MMGNDQLCNGHPVTLPAPQPQANFPACSAQPGGRGWLLPGSAFPVLLWFQYLTWLFNPVTSS